MFLLVKAETRVCLLFSACCYSSFGHYNLKKRESAAKSEMVKENVDACGSNRSKAY